MGFLERLTGITPLLTDPTKPGGGIQRRGRAAHSRCTPTSTERCPLKTGTRRVNTFVFLNEHWKDGTTATSSCGTATSPSAGAHPAVARSIVVFLSTDFSYHGHPTPLTPPNGRLRRSLSTYYYSMSTPPASECVNGDCDTRHEVLWKPLPPEVLGKECRRPPPA